MKKLLVVLFIGLTFGVNAFAKEDRSNKNIWVEEIGPTEDQYNKWIYKVLNTSDDNQRYMFIVTYKNKLDKIREKISGGCNKNGFKYYYIFKEDNIFVYRAISGANVVRAICANSLEEIKGKISSKSYDYFSSKTYNDDYKYFSFTSDLFEKGIVISNAPKNEIDDFYAKIEEEKKKKKKIAEKKKKDKREAIDLAATLYYWGLSTDKLSMYFYGGKNKNNLKGHMTITDENYLPWHGIFGISAKDYEKFDITAKTKNGTTLEFIGKNSKKQKIKLNFKNKSAILLDSEGNKSSLKLKKPEKLFAAKSFDSDENDNQKPKKKKPKNQSPNDGSIIAAASGTGFFVSRTGHVITNYHVIEGCDANKLTFKGKEIKADTLAVDKMNDLAILKANLRPSKVYPVATEDAALLEDIIIAGYPLGKKVSAAIKTSKGSVTALAGYGDNFSEFQTDAALNQGNSGGPIMNQKGNVVGVAVANYGKKEGVESFNFGVKSSTLRTFANANGLKFISPNRRDLSNKDLGELITSGTVYLECFMTVAKIKRMIAEAENRKAFFSEHQ